MAKQKKNSNYQTEKTIAEKAKIEEEKQKKEQTEKIKLIAIISGVVVGVLALIIGFLFAVGAFKYHPEVSEHVTMTIDGYGNFHIELYGKDAPDASAKFVELANKHYFDNKNLSALKDGKLYSGDTAVSSPTETSKNKIALEKGVLCVKYNKTSCQYLIITEDNVKLDDNYIAIGKIDDLGTLNKILDAIKTDENGKITAETAPLVTSVSKHASH